MSMIATTPIITSLLAAHAPVAIGVSGGKDSDAAAFATVEHLDQLGHQGPRLLIHSDLGRTEWAESLPQCERLAERFGVELTDKAQR
jgi:tRNA(Ile)-lysidine synthase TilS/MesJ